MIKFRNLIVFIFILLVLLMVSKKYSYQVFKDYSDPDYPRSMDSLTRNDGNKKCLTGYYGNECTLSVVKQPLDNCPTNYYKDSECKMKGCIEVSCGDDYGIPSY